MKVVAIVQHPGCSEAAGVLLPVFFSVWSVYSVVPFLVFIPIRDDVRN